MDELKALLDEFLNRWTIDNVIQMTLQEYVGLGNKNTFCQWVETKTRRLGSIKGLTSIKFGIYERKDRLKKPKNYQNDVRYSWLRNYGDNRRDAFNNVKRDIIKIIHHAERGKFEQIDNIRLPDLFKWKVAFLYSNERLIPIYKHDVLIRIAEHFGMSTDRNTAISEIQSIMMINKPAHLNVYEFMLQLYNLFGETKEKKQILGKSGRRSVKRKAATGRNTKTQVRTITRSYLAEQRHNKLQEALKKILIKKYGKNNVILEENFVDLKVIQPADIYFYEVKSSPYASACVKEALGQILLYSLNDTDRRPKTLVVVGQYPATANDNRYIDFLKDNLKMGFEYISVEIE